MIEMMRVGQGRLRQHYGMDGCLGMSMGVGMGIFKP